ncbi:MAG: transporter substrate-binding domain-containing protein, partial [Hymenobacteraceae bacterium]|nr:transporter substrate-binding domain-containing protein [Hymenobacteraceae bacterium]MDX5397012.1 transporter substrate-binding domain-containing protein [Hymenobacteraceae bacterium]MDX5513086.1 transporter substrate-binding domain-containing protein [Hymenobacteraceae bacterium]
TPPFIMKQANGEYTGLSVDLWKEIAADGNLNFTFKEYDLPGLLQALEQGEIDVCINPLTVTSDRVRKFDFTQPFYISNLAIATSPEDQSQWLLFLQNLFSPNFLKAVLLLFLVILFFGLLVWLFERRHPHDDQFGKGGRGVWEGIWWSAVTMTTVGYGDKSPKTVGGRIVALIWMFTAIIIISGFTASIASSLTVDQLEASIKSVDDLKNVSTGAITGSTSERFLQTNNISYTKYATPQEALQAIKKGDLKALVYDEPVLKYLIKEQQLEEDVVVLPNRFGTQYYSLSLPKGSPLLDQINPILLKKINEVEWKGVLNQYNLQD